MLKVFQSKYVKFFLFKKKQSYGSFRSTFDPKTSENETISTPTEVPSKIQIRIQQQGSQDSENTAPMSPSFFEQMSDEINSFVTGRTVSNFAKMATNKVSELLSMLTMVFLKFSSLIFSLSFLAFSENPAQPNPTPTRSSSISKEYDKNESFNYMKHGSRNYNTAVTHRQREFIRQQSVELKANTHSENQLFLKDIVNSVLDGAGIGWLKINRVKKLMEDENYRNFVLSRLNVNLDKKYSDEDAHIDDVVSNYDISSMEMTIIRIKF